MSTIHNKFTGHEDSYEQAVRDSGEREIIYAISPEKMERHRKERDLSNSEYHTRLKEAYKDEPPGYNLNEANLPHCKQAAKIERPDYHAAGIAATDPDTMIPNHPDYSKQAENNVFAEAFAKMYLRQCNLLSKEQELKHKIIPVILDNLSIFSRNTIEGYKLLQSHFSNDPAFMNHPDYMRLVVHQMD
jgi:hypothetical protein